MRRAFLDFTTAAFRLLVLGGIVIPLAAVERLNGRLKGFYKLNQLRVRGLLKVRVHATLSAIVLLATATAFQASPRKRLVTY